MTDLVTEVKHPQRLIPGWLPDDQHTLDGITDIDTNQVLYIAGYGNFVRNRAIDDSNLELPSVNVEMAHIIGKRMQESGAPAIFSPVLANFEPQRRSEPVVAFGLQGLPGQEKTTHLAYLAYLTGSDILSLDHFYPGYTASEYLDWLKEAKPKSYLEARGIIWSKLPEWLQKKKLGQKVENAPERTVEPFYDVLERGYKNFAANRRPGPWLMVDLPGLPRMKWYKPNRDVNPFDLAGNGCEIIWLAPEISVNHDEWITNTVEFLKGSGLEEALKKRGQMVERLLSVHN